ncbi:hypothetical protein B0J12DRAFT_70671 [Macrophomina phaseolina]|uniref:SnoaL-like domain-containing protein n=1 Tax=Macrophomina phaseolina TaxID=35725 RepID=A0ABQ8GDC6_9PEZI|nr:hypothetical protein B0J12DRAFT_70671 [Macrophomina phaseolina]
MQLPASFLLAGWLTFSLGASQRAQRILASAAPTPSDSSAAASCPALAPRPLTVQELSTAFPPRAVYDASAVESIKRSLTLYAFAIDGRDWEALASIFTDDATANYGAPIGELSGLDTIKETLPPYLTIYTSTQHMLGTQLVDVCGEGAAVSITYFTAAHFRNDTSSPTAPVDDSQVLYAFGQYQDRWRREGGAQGQWKIEHRNLVYMVSLCPAPGWLGRRGH